MIIMTPHSDVSKFIDEISQKNACIDDYNSLEIMFSGLNIQDFNHIAEESRIVDLLVKMDLSDPEVYNLALKFTSKIFDTVDLKKYISNNPETVNTVLTSSNEHFKCFLLEKLISYLDGSGEVVLNQSVIYNIFLNIFNENNSVMSHARNFFLKHKNSFDLTDTNKSILDYMNNLEGFSMRLRLMELLIELSEKNVKFYKLLRSFLSLKFVNEYLDDSDIVIKINFLQLVNQLLCNEEGYQILVNYSESFVSFMTNVQSDPAGNLIKPYLNCTAMSFFRFDPKEWSTSSVLIGYFSNEMDEKSIDAIEAISWTYQHEQCLQYLIALSNGPWSKFISTLKDFIYNYSSFDERVLTCLSFLFNVEHCRLDQSFKIKSEIFNSLNKNLLRRLLDHTKTPYLSLRKLVLQVYQGVVSNPLIYTHIVNHSESINYLLDRSAEDNILEEKNDVLRLKLSINETIESKVQDQVLKQRFGDYIKEGVFGPRTNQPTIAMEV